MTNPTPTSEVFAQNANCPRAPEASELVERLLRVRHAINNRWFAEHIKTIITAADTLTAQQAEIERLRAERHELACAMAEHARAAGEAKGRLEMSEAAGVVDMWRERVERLEAALGPHNDVLDGVEVRLNNDGTIDEIVTSSIESFHLEQMDDGQYWIGLTIAGKTQHIMLTREGKRIRPMVYL